MNRQQTCTCLDWDWIWYRKLYHWNYPKKTWSLHFSKKYLACVWWWGYDLLWIHLGKGKRRTSGMKRRIKKKYKKRRLKRLNSRDYFEFIHYENSSWKMWNFHEYEKEMYSDGRCIFIMENRKVIWEKSTLFIME